MGSKVLSIVTIKTSIFNLLNINVPNINFKIYNEQISDLLFLFHYPSRQCWLIQPQQQT